MEELIASLGNISNMQPGRSFPLLRLLPKELRNQARVEVPNQLRTTASTKNSLDPLHGCLSEKWNWLDKE